MSVWSHNSQLTSQDQIKLKNHLQLKKRIQSRINSGNIILKWLTFYKTSNFHLMCFERSKLSQDYSEKDSNKVSASRMRCTKIGNTTLGLFRRNIQVTSVNHCDKSSLMGGQIIQWYLILKQDLQSRATLLNLTHTFLKYNKTFYLRIYISHLGQIVILIFKFLLLRTGRPVCLHTTTT